MGLFKEKEEAIRVCTETEKMHEDFINWHYREYLPAQKQEQPAR